MKKLILILTIALLSFAQGTNTVYVCMSETSVAYHSNRNCKGLSKCTHEIKAMSKEQAIKLGKRACHLCWKN